jgi:hypothetical protein
MFVGRLSSLTISFQKIATWQANVNACVRELGPLGNDTKVQTTFTFEALRIEVGSVPGYSTGYWD